MQLRISNIGKIDTAEIEIDGIAIIAGVNNTGKSTIGKTLHAVINGLFQIDSSIERERLSAISRVMANTYHDVAHRRSHSFVWSRFADTIVSNKEKYLSDGNVLLHDLMQIYKQVDSDFDKYENNIDTKRLMNSMTEALTISDEELMSFIIYKKFRAEFSEQIINLYPLDEKGEIEIRIKNTEISICLDNDGTANIINPTNLRSDAIYIDDPFIMDFDSSSILGRAEYNMNHRLLLYKYLIDENNSSNDDDALSEIITIKKLKSITDRINEICAGRIEKKQGFAFACTVDDGIEPIEMRNVSAGIKPFIIVKTLLLNGRLRENGIIILDEPEIHLHPEWQLVLAEVIVLIQKEFNMHILLTTHSPYFLDAIETYTHKYGLTQRCRYYLAEPHGTTSIFTDVTDNIERIYQKLSAPFQTLENARYTDND